MSSTEAAAAAPDPGVATPITYLNAGAADPHRVFASFEDDAGAIHTVSYAAQLERAERAASILAGYGVTAGERVHVHIGNRQEFFDLWFGTSLVGATMVPTNPQVPPAELAGLIALAGTTVSCTTPDLVATVRAAAPKARIAVFDRAGLESTDRLLATHRPSPSDVAAILYTSGTTSRPKGVMVTNANYVQVGLAVARHLQVRATDRWLIALPLFHANAQYYCTMSALVAGASVAVTPRFSASRWGRQAATHRVTLASLFAAPIRMILASERRPEDRANALRAVLFAQNVSDAQAAEFESRFDTQLLQLYGMTETVLPPTINPAGDERRWGSIGRTLPGVAVRLTDDDGRDVPPGEIGELRIGGRPGETLALGYAGDPVATEAAFDGGWLRTGDLARLDDDGFYTFIDRSKDMIKRAGENVAASEVESVLQQHPAVTEAAVIGAPDPVRDQSIVAYVVPTEQAGVDEKELLAFCAERLARFKVPERLVIVKELPRTSVGKVNRAVLRDVLGTGGDGPQVVTGNVGAIAPRSGSGETARP